MPRRIPTSGAPLLLYKLRHDGLGWLLRRLCEEWEMPRTTAGQAAYRGLRGIGRTLGVAQRTLATGVPVNPAALYAFYDLGVAPITFDFLWFLVGAELERRRRGLAAIQVVIVPGPRDGLRREDAGYDAAVTPAARRDRVGSILLPACGLLSSVAGATVAKSRKEAAALAELAATRVFPARYEPALPVYPDSSGPLRAARDAGAQLGVLRATAADLAAVDRWLAAQGVAASPVTITLRDYGYMPERNSNYPAWTAFARRLDSTRHPVVFVPDASHGREPPAALEQFRVYNDAAVTLGLRMALYERAYLNLGVNNGPMGLCWLNERTRYITFKILTEAAPQATPEYMRHLGFEIGASLPGAGPWQRWVWENDDLPVIEREFAAMAEMIERSRVSPPAPRARARSAAG
jgi:hypothetical protein